MIDFVFVEMVINLDGIIGFLIEIIGNGLWLDGVVFFFMDLILMLFLVFDIVNFFGGD